jgi:hypothetical protein
MLPPEPISRSSRQQIFLSARREPRLRPCAVLFLDLLGVQEMTSSRDASHRLKDLNRAFTRMYRDYLSPFSPWPSAFFSDTLVLASPITRQGDEGTAIIGLAEQAAWLQLNLLSAGFFSRGGLSLGKFHIHEGLVFGPALVQAYQLESQTATHPRVVLGREAERSQRDALAGYIEPSEAPQASLLLRDGDGWTFINYLGLLFDDTDDPRTTLLMHRDLIVERLREQRGTRRVWEKYRWVAEYHNEVVRQQLSADRELAVPSEMMTWPFTQFGHTQA